MNENHLGYVIKSKHFLFSVKFIDSLEFKLSQYFYHCHRLEVKLITIRAFLRNYPASQHIRCLDILSRKTIWVNVSTSMVLDIRELIEVAEC